MSTTVATYNLAAERVPVDVGVNAIRRLLRVARVVNLEEVEKLIRMGRLGPLPGVIAPLPDMPELDRRPTLYKPGPKDDRIKFRGSGVEVVDAWPLKGWRARALIPYVILTDPDTGEEILFINYHLLHNAPRGSRRDLANERIVRTSVRLADRFALPTMIAGDFNRRPHYPGNARLTQSGFRIHSPGGTHGRNNVPIDYAAVRGLKVLNARVLEGYPGDHSPVLYTIEPE